MIRRWLTSDIRRFGRKGDKTQKSQNINEVLTVPIGRKLTSNYDMTNINCWWAIINDILKLCLTSAYLSSFKIVCCFVFGTLLSCFSAANNAFSPTLRSAMAETMFERKKRSTTHFWPVTSGCGRLRVFPCILCQLRGFPVGVSSCAKRKLRLWFTL